MFIRHNWFTTITLLFATGFYASLSFAQSLAAAQDTLLGFQNQLITLQTEQQQLQNYQQKNASQLASFENKDSPEKDRLDSAKNRVNEAKIVVANNPSSEEKAKLKNFEFKLVLAERKFKKANAAQLELQQDSQNLTAQLAASASEINQLNTKVIAQREIIEKARIDEQAIKVSLLAKQQQQRAAASKANKKAAAVKAANLNTPVAVSSADVTRKTVSSKPLDRVIKPTLASPIAPVLSSVASPTALQVNAQSSASSQETNNSTNNATNAKSQNVTLLSTLKQIEKEQRRVAAILATPEAKKSSRYNKILNVKKINSDGTNNKAVSNSMRPQGHNIYSGVAKLRGGDTIFTVGLKSWRLKVPKPLNNEFDEYTVIYDGSDPKKPHIAYFLKPLFE